jgi:16S rRNA (guanine(1405)-N(7))-methyltransferase
MTLDPAASYWCCDIDQHLVDSFNAAKSVLPVTLTADLRDVVVTPSAPPADLALLLKTVTTIEQQRASATQRLLAGLDCRHIVVSFPRRSLSGRRGYADGVESLLAAAATGTRYAVADQADIGAETLLLLA